MGLPQSKDSHKEDDIQEGSIPSTPILAEKNISRISLNNENHMGYEMLDPRSPSQLFSRTPIQLINESPGKYELCDTPEKHFKYLSIDPRSPATDFIRTPIVISASPDKKLPIKLHNKNLDNVLKSSLITPTKVPNVIPPKLLESSPITQKLEDNAYKRKSLVGLLETNIDFTETDLDAVIREKYYSPIKGEVIQSNIDPRSPTNDFVRTPIQAVKKLAEIEENDIHTDHKKDDYSEEEVEDKHEEVLCEFPLVTCDSTEEISQEGKNIEIILQEINIVEVEMFKTEEESQVLPEINCVAMQNVQENHSAPVSPPAILVTTPIKSKSEPTTPPFINLTADVKELDKKLTNLIYQDDSLVCPKVVKNKEQSRTPLGDRNGTNHRKSIQKLKVSDKPRKSQYAVSKIPVFKERKGNCENTPPTSLGRKQLKPKKSQWDNDVTLVI